MKPAVLIPFFAAIQCLEIALIFFFAYARVSRRPENAVFGAIALVMSGMVWCILGLDQAQSLRAGLLWYRCQFTLASLGAAACIHFVALMARPTPPPRPWLVTLYGVTLLLAAAAHHPLVLAPPPPTCLFSDIDREAPGPLFLPYALLLIAAPLGAAGLGLRRLRRAPPDTGRLAVLRRHLSTLLLGLLLVLGASVLELGQLFLVPKEGYDLPINPRAVAVTLFCALAALSLGREALARERERRQWERMAEARAQAVQDVRHEVGNKLAGITAPLRLALRGPAGPADRERLAGVLRSAEEMRRMVQTMLNVARLEAGQPPQLGPPEPTDVAALVEGLRRRKAAELDLQVQAEALRGSPPPPVHPIHVLSELAAPALLMLHPESLTQALANLLDNAVKYSPRGGDVTVSLRRAGDELHISVSDPGIGIAPERLPGLFRRRLDRGPATDYNIPGTGLGLHIVGRLVEAQGGRLRVESRQGQGSTFFLSLPWQPAEAEQSPEQSQKGGTSGRSAFRL